MKEEDTKVADIFDKDIENFGKDLDKMIEHLNIVIATHNKQVEEIERLKNIINGVEDLLKRFKGSYREIPIQIVLNEIRELKGEDKE